VCGYVRPAGGWSPVQERVNGTLTPRVALTMKGIGLTGKGKIVAVITALCIALGLTVVPLAVAYKVPGPPGTPGGKPTKPAGGSRGSKKVTKSLATKLAGYTGAELALRTPVVSFKFPSAGSIACSVTGGGITIGSGGASKGRKGRKTFKINLTKKGRTFLVAHNGKAISLNVACTFTPNKGKAKTSTSTVVLDT